MPRRSPTAQPKRFEKRRCAYCNKLIDLTKPNRRFCNDRERNAFHQQGMALGPLKEKLPKWIAKEVAKQLAELWDTRLASIALEAERLNKLMAERHDAEPSAGD